jgi:ribosomal protein S15P/S13E
MKLSKREPKHMGEVMSDIAERYDKLTKTKKMNRIVRMLEEMKVKEEQKFISNSLIKRASIDSEVPDVDADLERIVELNEAISVLNNHLMQKPKRDE